MIEAEKKLRVQELSIKLAGRYINSPELKNAHKDIVVLNLVANGYAAGAYMGWFWSEATPSRWALWWRLGSESADYHAHKAAKQFINSKYRSASIGDRELLRYAVVRGFRDGADECRNQRP